MRDAVADVLAERRALVRRDPAGIIGSLILHALIVLFVLLSMRWEGKRDKKKIINIQLKAASTQPVRTAETKPQQAAPAAPPTEAKPEPKPAEPPKVIEPPKPVVETKPKPQTPPVRDPSLFGQSKEKPKPQPQPPAAATQASPKTPPAPPSSPPASSGTSGSSSQTSTVPMPAIGSAGIAGLEGGDFPYTIYLDRMITLIGQRWFRPQVSDQTTAQIYFEILRDGRIREIEVERSSGNPVFDRAAVRAVRESNPLPPLPPGYSGSFLGVHLIFH